MRSITTHEPLATQSLVRLMRYVLDVQKVSVSPMYYVQSQFIGT